MGGKRREIAGKRFGKLVVIEPVINNKQGWLWLCKCDCGNETIVQAGRLMRGETRSCGCLQRVAGGQSRATHRQSNSRLYHIWAAIKQRCNNPKAHSYKWYGARGIKICDEWLNSFEAFAEWAMASGYDENAKRGECTIDRIDVNGDYEPSNCRWATEQEQANNVRNQRLISWNGKTMSLSAWAREVGIKRSTINSRLEYGWSVEDALTIAPTR